MSSSNWFDDQEHLLTELKRAESRRYGGLRISGYDDFHELRRGGQGIVYTAVQRSTRRRVAVKVLLDGALAAASTRRRFEREIDLVATLRHPNIVSIYDSGITEDGRPYYVMEFIDGASLDEVAASATLPDGTSIASSLPARSVGASDIAPTGPLLSIPAVIHLMTTICDAVAYAHQRGVIHRDLKPSNVRIDAAGEPHILDFGLAKLTTDEARDLSLHAGMTQSGHFMGSLPWASPEQAEGGASRVDVRSDIYSLGVMLYQMLTGRLPYDVSGSLRQALENIQQVEPHRPGVLRREIDVDLETIVLKCLAKDPQRRYQSVTELSADLRHWQAGEPIDARRASAWYAVRKQLHRYRVATVFSIAFVVLAVGFSLTMAWLYQRAVDAEQLAEQRREQADDARRLAEKRREQAEVETAKARKTLQYLQSMLFAAQPERTRGRPTTVVDLLDEAAREIDTQFAAQPDVAAELHHTVGWTYWSLGELAKALPHLDREMTIKQEFFGPEAAQTLIARNDYALLLSELGRHSEARPLLEEAYAGMKRVLGPEHESTLSGANNVATVLWELGEIAESERVYFETYETQRRLFGEDGLQTLTTKNNLAQCFAARGQAALAEKMFREIYDARSAQLGEDDPATILAHMNLAHALGDLGRLDEAEAAYRETIRASTHINGERHPHTLGTMLNLARQLMESGRSAEAEPLLRRVIELATEARGAQDPDVLGATNDLALLALRAGRPGEAERMWRQLAETMKRNAGESSPRTLTVLHNFAGALLELKRLDESERIFRSVLETRLRTMGEDHPQTIQTMVALASCLRELGRLDEAVALGRRANGIATRVLPEGDRTTLLGRSGLGEALLRSGHPDEAEALLSATLKTMQERFGAQHADTTATAERLVRVYRAGGKMRQAEEIERGLRATSKPASREANATNATSP